MVKKTKTQKWLQAALLFLALFAICMAPLLSNSFYYSRTQVKVEPENIQYVSVRNTCVTQQIYCEGRMSNFGITFYAPSGALYGDGTVTITLSQGEKSVSETVRAADLRVRSSYYVVDEARGLEANENEEMTYELRHSLSDFLNGDVILSICGNNLPDGTDLFCEVSSTVVSGLPSAMADDNILGHPLVISWQVLHYDAHFYYELILEVFLLLLLAGTVFLLVFRRRLFESSNILYWITVGIIILVVSIRIPYASFFGEPRSEAAYEFWYKAENLGFFGSLMSLMSGEALAWLERIFMWTVNAVFPRKYVFVAAQLLELSWIAMVTALPCRIGFRCYFRDEIRLFFSLLLGTGLLFDSAYFFWSCSYWSIFFFIPFALRLTRPMSRPRYAVGLILTVILCVSRIYHILLIPLAFLALLLFHRKYSRQFSGYCITVILAAAFEGVYSLLSGENLAGGGSSFFQNLGRIGFGRFFNNVLYYQAQIINSFFTGAAHRTGSGANFLSMLFFAVILLLFATQIFKKQIGYAFFTGALGYLSLGTIAINVYTSGSYAAVSFPMNYAAPVRWSENVYQEADLHFSYAYICLVFLIAGVSFWLKQEVSLWMNSYAVKTENAFLWPSNILGHLFTTLTALLCACVVSFGRSVPLSEYKLSVEWENVWQITENRKYFLAVNTFYRAAPISLEEGTDEMIYGLDENGALFLWKVGVPRYQFDTPYSEAAIGTVSDITQREILSVTAKRALTNFNVRYVAVLRDVQGNELARAEQAQREPRLWLDFIFDQPVKGAASVTFELADGSAAYVDDAIQVGYIL